ncbi:MAG TPA: polyprenyl diphosphate synthase [Candidatus Baltobacteraceae bacterium]
MTPRHVAIIMDGNRRWARARGLPAILGHRYGLTALRRTVHAARDAGVTLLTAFAFSDENFQRSSGEVDAIMSLAFRAAYGELRKLAREGVRVRLCGRTERLPARTLVALEQLVSATSVNAEMTLNLAIDYGGRREIGDAMRQLAREVRAGLREPDSIDERAVASRLYTADLPDPDLIIRTGGELRLSNFLLFQAAYAEFWATPTYWPDFDETHLRTALADFALRQRRYGT